MALSVPVGKRGADGLQNHRMFEVPTSGAHLLQPPDQAGTLLDAQDHVQMAFEGSPRRETPQPL